MHARQLEIAETIRPLRQLMAECMRELKAYNQAIPTPESSTFVDRFQQRASQLLPKASDYIIRRLEKEPVSKISTHPELTKRIKDARDKDDWAENHLMRAEQIDAHRR